MKLLLAIVRDDYAPEVTAALNQGGLSVTRISSTGGFWRRGNVTLVLGVEDDQVEKAMEIINQHAGPAIPAQPGQEAHPPRRATIFVLGVESAHRY
jgi:uncharacterized protein YaaQ